ncbi:uncharacterized protein LOC129912567 isoform X2 [Episyrphus balteatus]|uniref:uncharacterized protein LOC129912567 isoform X2 n=1 Tax=Episyrphus balteatus TaxID=286459 RepID=UPI002485EE39|nr:uncharacterized protein LOC129912567 isoform X2 [Episyrphus balteatus]
METEKILSVYTKCKCTCNNFKHKKNCNAKKRQNENLIYNMEQRTFISFATDIVSIIAFIFFGSVIFWLAITRIVIDFLRKIYLSDRCTRIVFVGLLTILFFSITTHVFLNKRAWKIQNNQEKIKLTKQNVTVPVESPKLSPEPEYLKVTIKDKQLKKLSSENKTNTNIPKKLTVSIINEKKKEVFKTSKNFLVPEMALEMKNPPALLVSLRDIILENY